MDVILARHLVLKAIRSFLYDRGYLEVETPYLANAAPSDPYIEPLTVFVGDSGPYYLHTSPEIGMKKVLAAGMGKIFQICKVFREEEFQEHHSVEFTMVEWYLSGTYLDAIGETRGLIQSVSRALGGEGSAYTEQPWNTYELGPLFLELTGINPLFLSREDLFSTMVGRCFQGLKPDDRWEDLFFKLLIQEVEPRMLEREGSPYFIKDWPASLTAMAKKKDEYSVERFELYMRGLEIANGYTELLDPAEQRTRVSADNEVRQALGKRSFPPDHGFFDALAGIRGPVAGVSVGVDRLLVILLGKERISEVLPDRFTL